MGIPDRYLCILSISFSKPFPDPPFISIFYSFLLYADPLYLLSLMISGRFQDALRCFIILLFSIIYSSFLSKAAARNTSAKPPSYGVPEYISA